MTNTARSETEFGIDKHGDRIFAGDYVYYFIPGHPGSKGDYAYVAGEMRYSENGSHVLLLNENEIGMPIHAGHCQLASSGHLDLVQPWIDRYLAKWPDALKAVAETRRVVPDDTRLVSGVRFCSDNPRSKEV